MQKFSRNQAKNPRIPAKNRVETLSNWARHARRTALCTRQRTQSRDKDFTSEKAT
jgi:hypothetical protein